MKVDELFEEDDLGAIEAQAKKGKAKMGPIRKYEAWHNRHDMWHPDFPHKFADCVGSYIKTEADLDTLGAIIADTAHSFYPNAMQEFIEYAKEHPIPVMGDDEEQAEYLEKLEEYAEKALHDM